MDDCSDDVPFPCCTACGAAALMPEQPDVALGLQMEALVGAANRLVCAACGANVVCLKASVLDAACRAFIVLRASARMDPRAWWKQKVDKEKAKVERLREGRW